MTTISVVIPTYQRAEIVLETINLLSKQSHAAKQIIIVDQTQYLEDDASAAKLQKLNDSGVIIWKRLQHPSIPNAMNTGLIAAVSDYVLFLDDDCSFDMDFLANYARCIESNSPVAAVGQVLQPGESPVSLSSGYDAASGFSEDLRFPFNSNQPHRIANCMAGNLLVNRKIAIQAGGFDCQFEGAAYRFETEFARRLIKYAGEKFLFWPEARINHLKISTGGTRAAVANFLTSASPVHSQGEYYFILRESHGRQRLGWILRRLLGSVKARFYVTRPWWLPFRILGELRGLSAAARKYREGPRLIQPKD